MYSSCHFRSQSIEKVEGATTKHLTSGVGRVSTCETVTRKNSLSQMFNRFRVD
jgi:hypothetical protein